MLPCSSVPPFVDTSHVSYPSLNKVVLYKYDNYSYSKYSRLRDYSKIEDVLRFSKTPCVHSLHTIRELDEDTDISVLLQKNYVLGPTHERRRLFKEKGYVSICYFNNFFVNLRGDFKTPLSDLSARKVNGHTVGDLIRVIQISIIDSLDI